MNAGSFDKELIDAARRLRRADPGVWERFITDHPELAAEVKKPRLSQDAKAGGGTGNSDGCEPGKCWSESDRKRQHRSRGAQGDGAVADTGDSADRDIRWQLDHSGGSLLDLHMELNGGTAGTAKGLQGWTTGYYVQKETTDPNQLEVCRYCGKDLGLPRDDQGFVIREPVGQRQYCDKYCKDQQDNARDRRRRRRAGTRSYDARYGVVTGQVSTGPQKRFATGEVIPWTVPFWAADPWLKFVRTGSVPIGRGRTISYADPVGDTAARRVDEERRSNTCDKFHIALLREVA